MACQGLLQTHPLLPDPSRSHKPELPQNSPRDRKRTLPRPGSAPTPSLGLGCAELLRWERTRLEVWLQPDPPVHGTCCYPREIKPLPQTAPRRLGASKGGGECGGSNCPLLVWSGFEGTPPEPALHPVPWLSHSGKHRCKTSVFGKELSAISDSQSTWKVKESHNHHQELLKQE